MKKWLILVASACLGTSVWAQNLAPTTAISTNAKIGVVDLRVLMQKVASQTGADKQLEKQFKDRHDKIVAQQQKLDDEVQNFTKNSAVLSDADKQKQAQALDAKKRDIVHEQQDFQDDLTQAQQNAMKDILKKIQSAVGTVAKNNNYELILPKDSVPYASDNLDITNQVMSELQKTA